MSSVRSTSTPVGTQRFEGKRKVRDDEARWFKKLDQDPMGDLDELKKCSIDKGISVNVFDENYENGLLRISGRHGNAHKVSWLITNGADATLTDANGLQALHRACSAVPGSRDNVQLLLTASGVNANTRAEDGKTPLMYAARKGRTEFLKLLLSRGADVTLVDDRGFTALHHMCACGLSDAQEVIAGLQVLLTAGCNINSEQGGGTPLVVAYEARGLDDVVEWIVEKDGDNYIRTRDGQPVACEPSPALGDLIERKRRAKRMLAALEKKPASETFTVNFPSSRRGSADDAATAAHRRHSLGLGGTTGSLSQALAAVQSSPSNGSAGVSGSSGSINKSASGRDLTTLLSPNGAIASPGSDRGNRTLSASRATSYIPSSGSGDLSAARAAALTITSPPGSHISRPRTPSMSITPPTPATSFPSPGGSGSTSPPARASSAASQARRESRKKKAQTMPSGGISGLAAVLETDPDWESRIRERIENKRNISGDDTTNGMSRRKDSDSDPFEALASRAPPSSLAPPPSSLAASLATSQSFLSSSFSGPTGMGSMQSVASSLNPSYLLATSPSDHDPFGMSSPSLSQQSSLGGALARSRSPTQRGGGVSFSSSTFDPFSNSPPPTAASSLAHGGSSSPPLLAQSPNTTNMFDLFGSSPSQQHAAQYTNYTNNGGMINNVASQLSALSLHQHRQVSGSSAVSQGYPSSSPMAMPTPNRHHHGSNLQIPSTPMGYYGQQHMQTQHVTTPSSMSHYGNNGHHGVTMFDPFFASPPSSAAMVPNSPATPNVGTGGYHPNTPAHNGYANQYNPSPQQYSHQASSPLTPSPSPGMVAYHTPRATSMPVGMGTPMSGGAGMMGVLPTSMMRTSSAPTVTVDPFSHINPFANVSHALPPATMTTAAAGTAGAMSATSTPVATTPSAWRPF